MHHAHPLRGVAWVATFVAGLPGYGPRHIEAAAAERVRLGVLLHHRGACDPELRQLCMVQGSMELCAGMREQEPLC